MTQTRAQRTKNLLDLMADAKALRHNGFNARADYYMMEIVVRDLMFGWEEEKMAKTVDSAVRVPWKFIKDHA